LVNGAQLLGITLEIPAYQRKVLVDPDEQATAIEPVLEAATNDHVSLFVLGTNRVEKLLSVIATALPVGPDEGDRARVLIVSRQCDPFGQQASHRGRIRAIFNR
jgi:hypothetical protein